MAKNPGVQTKTTVFAMIAESVFFLQPLSLMVKDVKLQLTNMSLMVAGRTYSRITLLLHEKSMLHVWEHSSLWIAEIINVDVF